MKAEQRHALKQNSLVTGISNAPAFFQKHGSRLLLGLTLVLLAVILVRNYYARRTALAQRSAADLGDAIYLVSQIRNLQPLRQTARGFQPVAPGELVNLRNDFRNDADTKIQDGLDHTEDPKTKAQLLVIRGDLNWQLANFPQFAVPSQTPEKTPEELLKLAEDAYAQVLQPPLSDDPTSANSARMGLAAIAENRRQWDKAKQFYQQVVDDKAADAGVHELATRNLADLSTLQHPVLLAKLEKPTTAPAGTRPGFSSIPDLNMPPSTGPTSAPAGNGFSTLLHDTAIPLPDLSSPSNGHASGPFDLSTPAPAMPTTVPAFQPATRAVPSGAR